MYETQLAYAHLYVSNLERSVTFFSRFLDLQLSERLEKTALLASSQSSHHYELALQESEPENLSHVRLGFSLSEDAFKLAQAFLQTDGLNFNTEDRGWAWVIQLTDPDGNLIELFTDRRQQGGAAFWRGESKPLL